MTTLAAGEATPVRPKGRDGFWWAAARRFRKHRAGLVAAWLLAVLVSAALLAETIAPYGPNEQFFPPATGEATDPR